jgi:hypothetical protein
MLVEEADQLETVALREPGVMVAVAQGVQAAIRQLLELLMQAAEAVGVELHQA